MRKGYKSGMLTTIKPALSDKRGKKWLCSCECGSTADIYTNYLEKGSAKNCGCVAKLARENSGSRKIEKYIQSLPFHFKFDTASVRKYTDAGRHNTCGVVNRLFEAGLLGKQLKEGKVNKYWYFRIKDKGKIDTVFYKAMKALSLCNSDIRCV